MVSCSLQAFLILTTLPPRRPSSLRYVPFPKHLANIVLLDVHALSAKYGKQDLAVVYFLDPVNRRTVDQNSGEKAGEIRQMLDNPVSSTGRLVKGAGEGEELSAILDRALLGGEREIARRLAVIERKIVT